MGAGIAFCLAWKKGKTQGLTASFPPHRLNGICWREADCWGGRVLSPREF